MNKNIINLVTLFILIIPVQLYSETLYEKYAKATEKELESETKQLAHKINSVFDERNLRLKQSVIDFSEYFSSLKNLIFFCNRLAVYSSYEQDLKFGRDNEMFKGLPETPEKNQNQQSGKKSLINAKYEKLKDNVLAEIETYDDMSEMFMDTCLAKTNDMFFQENIIQNPLFKSQIEKYFLSSNEFKEFVTKKNMLTKFRPQLLHYIEKQVHLWKTPLPSPDTPIIDPEIVKKLG